MSPSPLRLFLVFASFLATLCVHAHDHIEVGEDPQDESRLGLGGPAFQLLLHVPKGEPFSGFLPLFPGGFFATELTFSSGENELDFAAGALPRVELVAVVGPGGASLAFWEVGSTAPTFARPTGWSAAEGDRPSFAVYEDASGYGHLHGRAFTVDQPGDYQVVFRAIDETSAFAPSAPKIVTLRAQTAPQLAIQIEAGEIRLRFTSRVNLSYDLQVSTTLSDNDWTTINFADGTGADHEFSDALADRPRVFYRLVEYR